MIDAVTERIAALRSVLPDGAAGLDGRPLTTTAAIRFELGDEQIDVRLRDGRPAEVVPGSGRADWAIVVDDPDLILPDGPARPLASVRGCGLRLGDTLMPLFAQFEMDRLTADRFPAPFPGSRLAVVHDRFATPVGGLQFVTLFEDGRPRYVGDDRPQDEKLPQVVMRYAEPPYWDYRFGRAPIQRLAMGGGVEGDWKDLFVAQGLCDAAPFADIAREYPELPAELHAYCQVLAIGVMLSVAAG